MLVDAIVLILFIAAWIFLAMLSWIALSVPRRARGALWAAPFAALGGVGGGALVPLAGLDNELGIGSAIVCWLSFRVWDVCDLGARFAPLARRRR